MQEKKHINDSELNKSCNESKEKKSNKFKKITKITIYIAIFFITGVAIFSSQIIVSDSQHGTVSWFKNLPIIRQISQLAESADRKLKGEKNNRINILLLGMGGKTHEGGNLTDTIMLASIEPSTEKVSLISFPRDMSVPIENMETQKINAVNAYAEMDEKGSGGLATSQAISDILGTPIDYYFRIDFQGFIDIVDKLGGIEINVENILNDYSYPIMGREEAEDYKSRFEHLYIKKGLTEMDGTLALKYARSRHGTGIEGSDFARSRRQQLVISAVKEKALSSKTFLNPKAITGIIHELNEHVSTNLKIWEMFKLWNIAKNIKKENISSKVLDDSPNGLLIAKRNEIGAYVLTPKSGDFEEIRYMVNNIFTDAPKEKKIKVIKEETTVEIYNGTWINGLASQVSLDIEKYGFIVLRIGNSSKQNFQKSVIYDLTYGEKIESLTVLKNKTNANISFSLPDWLKDDISKKISKESKSIQPDFILVLGRDADKSKSGVENILD
ncbi:LCP family protein [Candidatus Parcubacteria bacterium]|nr:LCP family protein [Candidatus Parcubacteria bacterium]